VLITAIHVSRRIGGGDGGGGGGRMKSFLWMVCMSGNAEEDYID